MIYHVMDIGNVKDIGDVWYHGGYHKLHILCTRKGDVTYGL